MPKTFLKCALPLLLLLTAVQPASAENSTGAKTVSRPAAPSPTMGAPSTNTIGRTGFVAPDPRHLYPNPDLADPKYYACHRREDCVPAQLPCGRVIVTNKATHRDVQGWFDFVGPQYKCIDDIIPQRAENIDCQHNKCTADIRQVPLIPPDSPVNRNPQYCRTATDCQIVIGNCGEKLVVNRLLQQKTQDGYDRAKALHTDHCFWPDGRTVKATRCEDNTCKIELEIPDQNHWSEPLHIESHAGGKN